MIRTKNDLKDYLKYERELYNPKKTWFLFDVFEQDTIWKYIWTLRHLEYHKNNLNYFRTIIWTVKLALLQKRTRIYINANCFGKGLRIMHIADGILVVNGAKIGNDCTIHAGVKIVSSGDYECPTLGNNIFLGVNAVVYGNVYIADGCVVGASSVVGRDCSEENGVYVGIPAKYIRTID